MAAAPYESKGMPGCIWSTAVVHVVWDCCPAGWQTYHKGSKGCTTRAFEATGSLDLEIFGVTVGHPGTRNDQTIVKFDGLVQAMHTGEIYADVTFEYFDANGVKQTERGLYGISDGGYHKWRCMISKHSFPVDAETAWDDLLASIRKDIERIFGILKKRFQILKTPIRFQDAALITCMFHTCCVLHNMILKRDKPGLLRMDPTQDRWFHRAQSPEKDSLNSETGDAEFDNALVDAENPDYCDAWIESERAALAKKHKRHTPSKSSAKAPVARSGLEVNGESSGHAETSFSFAMFVDSTDGTRTQAQAQFYELRRKLVDHYQWKSKK